MKRIAIYCGISGKQNNNRYNFTVDFNSNTAEDAIQFIEPYFTAAEFDDNTYWFGYRFNGKLEKDYRDACIQYLKNVQEEPELTEDNEFDYVEYSTDSISEYDLDKMIRRSLKNINLNAQNIDTVVYPNSNSNKLVRCICRSVKRYASNSDSLKMIQVLKSDPSEITIDIDKVLHDVESGELVTPHFNITETYLTDMLDKIHTADDFSLRRDIHPVKLRKYVFDFLTIKDTSDGLSDASNILIVDDFMTSGTTVRELIRIIRQYNQECNICIFTLLGNNRIK